MWSNQVEGQLVNPALAVEERTNFRLYQNCAVPVAHANSTGRARPRR
jgi:hypothetical protein